MPKQRKPYTTEFKRNAWRCSSRATTRPPRSCANSASAARCASNGETGQGQHGRDTEPSPSSGQQRRDADAELRHLRRENERLRQERDILKEAIGLFWRVPR